MLLPVTILGFFLRLIGAGQSFWLDEGASIEIASTPLSNLLAKMTTDFHPPLFYLLLKSWLPLAGKSEWLIRMPFIILASLTIPALFFFLKEALGNRKQTIATLAALFLAISPFHIYYSQELRMYALNALLTTLSWLALLRFQNKGGKKNFLLYIFFSTLNLYTFYGAFFNLAAQGAFLVYKKKKAVSLFLALLISVLLFLPWVRILLRQLETGDVLQSLPGWSYLSGSLTLKSLLLIPLKLYFGRITFLPKTIYFFLAGLASIFFIALGALGAIREKLSRPLVYWALFPLAFATLLSLKTPILGYWRYLFLLPALLSLSAIGIARFPPLVRKMFIITGLTLSTISIFVYHLVLSNQREDWRGLARFISKPQSLVVMNFPTVFAPLKFYAPDQDYFLTQDSLGHVRPDLIGAFQTASIGKIRVYHIDYLSDITDPSRSVLSSLSDDYWKVKETNFNNLGTV